MPRGRSPVPGVIPDPIEVEVKQEPPRVGDGDTEPVRGGGDEGGGPSLAERLRTAVRRLRREPPRV